MLPVCLHLPGRMRPALDREPAARWMLALQMTAALSVLFEVVPFHLAGMTVVLVYAGAALAVFALNRWPGVVWSVESSWILWAAAIWQMSGLSGLATQEKAWLAGVALLCWVPAVAMARHGFRNETGPESVRADTAQSWLATLFALVAGHRCFEGAALLAASLATTVVAVAVFRFGRVRAAGWASVVVQAWALVQAGFFVNSGRAEGWGMALATVVAVSFAAVALPAMLGADAFSSKAGNRLRWCFGAGGLALAFFAAAAQAGQLAPYVTVGWGIGSILIFMAGLFARIRPYRMLGLLGLAACVPRVFMVDLDSALHRIVAFVVLGLVLLWVGFSYHRFRHLIADEASKEARK